MSVKFPCHFCFVFFFLLQTVHCLEVYNITSSTPLFVNQTLISSNRTFELGFFTPIATTTNQYVGIWYNGVSPTKIVWVANREKPVMSIEELASFRIGTDGDLRLVDGQQNKIWSTNIKINSNNSYVELLDDGNLIPKDTNSGIIVWESFNHPSDTFLRGMKIGIDIKTGNQLYLLSWKSEADPSPGNFIFGIALEIPPQAFGWAGSRHYWRGEYWDKAKSSGIDDMDESYTSMFSLLQDPKQGTYLLMTEYPGILFPTMFVSSRGTLRVNFWDSALKEWRIKWKAPSNLCESYGTCGPFGICNVSSSPICNCLTGFAPKSYEERNKENWTGGCTRQTPSNCQRRTNKSSSNNTFD